MRRGNQQRLSYRVTERDHRFMTMLFIVMGALVFGAVILCATGLINPVP